MPILEWSTQSAKRIGQGEVEMQLGSSWEILLCRCVRIKSFSQNQSGEAGGASGKAQNCGNSLICCRIQSFAVPPTAEHATIRGHKSLTNQESAMGHQPPGTLPTVRSPADRLDSWKEIAAYLSRDVTTVQRWEKREGMPVHRHVHHKLGSVYAVPRELDVWAQTRNLKADGPKTMDVAEQTSGPPAPEDVTSPIIVRAFRRPIL